MTIACNISCSHSLMHRLALTLKYINMRVKFFSSNETKQEDDSDKDRQRERGCCVLTITLINLPVLGDAIDWNAIPLGSLISTFLSLLLSDAGCICVYKRKRNCPFSCWICGFVVQQEWELIKCTGSVFCFDSVMDFKYTDALQMVILQCFDVFIILN